MTYTYYIEVLLNETEDEDGRAEDRYQYGDVLDLVWSGEVEVPEWTAPGKPGQDILDLVFLMFNRGSGSFIGDVQYPHRSLSVGDCVRVDEVDLYVCESAGWKKVA